MTICSHLIFLPQIETVSCSMSVFNCCFLTCIHVSKEAGNVVWYSHLFKNFPQFFVIHRVKGFSVVNEAEVDAFLELSCFFYDAMDIGNLISDSSASLKPSLYIWNFSVHILLKPTWRILSINLLACEVKWKLLSRVWLSATPWNSPGQNTGVGSHSLLQC